MVVHSAEAAPMENIPVSLKQPDGKEINCFASGDEFFNWLHDANGVPVIQDPTSGYYVYGAQANGQIIPSPYKVGEVDPFSVGLKKLDLSSLETQDKTLEQKMSFMEGSSVAPDTVSNAPRSGELNNIVIFIRFSDDAEFTQNISYYESMFNSSVTGGNSLRNYYNEVSYGQLDVKSTFYPTTSSTMASYRDSHPRSYYMPYSSTNALGYSTNTVRKSREHILLKNAVDAISAQVPGALDLDGDNDGQVDNVAFVFKGSPAGWGNLLWAHRSFLTTQSTYLNNSRVYSYIFLPETSTTVSVVSHELFHSLGAPDLYHYTSNGISSAGNWDIMQTTSPISSPPRHMSVYMKYRYGKWISSIPVISSSGTYTLSPCNSSTNCAYRINSPNSSSEYFIVEYRRRIGKFESMLPGEGLLVYRINAVRDGYGNASGPPDELYLFRPGGTLTLNGTPDSANFSANVGRTAMNHSTNPYCFLSNGSNGGLNISNIGSIGSTISFHVQLENEIAGDGYEPDNTAQAAKTIGDGQAQNRSIHVAGDTDWAKFTLTQRSNVQIETSGSSGDTELWLYGPDSSTTQLAYDDDSGINQFSLINRSGLDALGPGTYYIIIQEYSHSVAIPEYVLSLTAAPHQSPDQPSGLTVR